MVDILGEVEVIDGVVDAYHLVLFREEAGWIYQVKHGAEVQITAGPFDTRDAAMWDLLATVYYDFDS